MEVKGFILKGIGGFYYVQTDQGLVTCTARGKFRREQISPFAGDYVTIVLDGEENGTICEIQPRKNFLVRPPLANLDRLFIIVAAKEPSPDSLMIDKTIAAAETKGIEPIVVLTKTDLQEMEELEGIYRLSGISCITVSAVTGEGVDQVRHLLGPGISAFTGNSGVGKSTLLNAVFPEFTLKTGEISQKLGRGRHTTREVELYPIGPDSYVADTPGFSTFNIERYDMWDKEQLVFGFREFLPFLGQCRFSSCSHTCEKDCAILQALSQGVISPSRHASYGAMYQEIKDVKQWQKNKNV